MGMEKLYSTEDLTTFYTEALNTTGIASKADLEKALVEGKVNLELKVDSIVPPEKQQEILENNPDQIEVLGKTRGVSYEYDNWNRKFVAKVKIDDDEVWMLDEEPKLPSGRKPSLQIVKTNGTGTIITDSISEAKAKTTEHFRISKWEKFRYSETAPKETPIEEGILLTDESFMLPDPIKYGEIKIDIDKETKEPITEELVAHPALTTDYWGGYKVVYYPDAEKAKEAQEKTLTKLNEIKNQKLIEEEKNSVLAEAEDTMEEVKFIEENYHEFGLTWQEQSDLRAQMWDISNKSRNNPREAKALLQKLKDKINKINEEQTERVELRKQVEKIEMENMVTCPCCGGSLYGGSCDNEHDPARFEFESDGYEGYIHPLVLSEIKVILPNGSIKYVARLLASGIDNRDRKLGQIYIRKDNDLNMYDGLDAWEGELGKVVYTNFGKIRTPEEAESFKTKKATQNSAYRKYRLPPTSYSEIEDNSDYSETEGSMAAAFKRASGDVPNEEKSANSEGGKDERVKLERLMDEAISKADARIAELKETLKKEKEQALDLSSGESEKPFAKKGKRIVALFNDLMGGNTFYTDIVEWKNDRIVRLILDDKHKGSQYVELEDEDTTASFYSEELGIPGVAFKAKIVDLTSKDKILEEQRKKLEKFQKRLNELEQGK